MFNPKKVGFFALIYQQVDEGLTLQERTLFNECRSLEARVKFVAGLSTVKLLLDKVVVPFHGTKSAKKSTQNREAGNAQFANGNIAQAQVLYSIAVFNAPPASETSQELSLALGNRSACLQMGKFYEGALEDIQLSFDAGYPEGKRFKLHERAAECHVALHSQARGFDKGHALAAVAAYKKAIAAAPKSNLKKDKLIKFVNDTKKKIDVISEKLSSHLDGSTKSEEREGRLTSLLKSMEPNKNYPCCHESVSFRYEPGRGRFAVANADIAIGTPILIEEPTLSYALFPEKFGVNCQHCFKVVKRVVPCSNCVWVVFCSKDCRDTALNTYHRYECAFMKHLLESGLNVYPFLTVRAVASAGLEKLLDLRNELESRDEARGTTDTLKERYSSDDFVSLYSLMAHEDMIDDDTWLLRTLVAVFLLKCFKMTQFFHSQVARELDDPRLEVSSEELSNTELFVGGVLLKMLNICPTNCHDVSEMETPVKDVFSKMWDKVSVGAAMYPTLALFNHSCEPSFMRCNYGNSVICVASKTIKKGDEIFENYGLMYTAKSLAERQKITSSHYGFKCECLPCAEDWPDTISMKARRQANINKPCNSFQKVKCAECGATLKQLDGYNSRNDSRHLTCLACGHETDLEKDIPLQSIKEESDKAQEHLQKGDLQIGLKHLERCEHLVNRHLSMPCVELSDAQIDVWRCLWLKFGSMKLVKLI